MWELLKELLETPETAVSWGIFLVGPRFPCRRRWRGKRHEAARALDARKIVSRLHNQNISSYSSTHAMYTSKRTAPQRFMPFSFVSFTDRTLHVLQRAEQKNFSYRNVPFRTITYRFIPYHTVSYLTLPFRTVSNRCVLNRFLLYSAEPYGFVPLRKIPFRTVPYHHRNVSYRTMPYRTLQYPFVPCHVSFPAVLRGCRYC